MQLFPMGAKRFYFETRKRLAKEPSWDDLSETDKKELTFRTMNEEFQRIKEDLDNAFPFKDRSDNLRRPKSAKINPKRCACRRK